MEMIDFSKFKFYDNDIPLIDTKSDSIPILISDDMNYLSRYLDDIEMTFVKSSGYFSSKVDTLFLSSTAGNLKSILIKPAKKKRFLIGDRIARLPPGSYFIRDNLSDELAVEVVLGFCFSSYKYQPFKKKKEAFEVLLCIPNNVNEKKVIAFLKAEFFVRNLINTPAAFLGPKNFENVIKKFAKEKQLKFSSIIGEELIKKNFPMIYTVGKAGREAPRFIELNWGKSDNYKVTLVGKGVCFDTGGLNIKSGTSMSVMKKDMAGAASVLGLAEIIICLNLEVSLTVLIPIVENSISSQSFRPGDVLLSRKGLSVEVNNTDAEGRLILADALHYADEGRPDLLVCMATLTGAARVALGPDIVPFYTDDDSFSDTLLNFSQENFDPVWRLPFHSEYENMIDSTVADLDNAPKSGMAGSITAALFLKKFVEMSTSFVHCDIFAWSLSDYPGRPIGGIMQGVRSLFTAIESQVKKD